MISNDFLDNWLNSSDLRFARLRPWQFSDNMVKEKKAFCSSSGEVRVLAVLHVLEIEPKFAAIINKNKLFKTQVFRGCYCMPKAQF